MNYQSAANIEESAAIVVDNFSSFSEEGNAFGRNKDIDEDSVDSIDEYQTVQAINNNLDDSISLIERAAKKFLPIYKELLKRMV
jgi:hypothetical protein